MSFDPHSLHGCRSWVASSPAIPSPEAKSSSKGKSQRLVLLKPRRTRCPVPRTMEASAEAPFRNISLLGSKSWNGDEPKQANPLAQPVQSERLPPLRQVDWQRQDDSPSTPQGQPRQRRGKLYVAFGQLLLKMTRTLIPVDVGSSLWGRSVAAGSREHDLYLKRLPVPHHRAARQHPEKEAEAIQDALRDDETLVALMEQGHPELQEIRPAAGAVRQ